MESPMMRSLPQSIEAEQSVIGAMIIDKSAIAQVFEKLNEDEFGLLICGVKGLKHLGTLRSRGKGEVRCTLKIDNKILGEKEIKKLVEKVIV